VLQVWCGICMANRVQQLRSKFCRASHFAHTQIAIKTKEWCVVFVVIKASKVTRLACTQSWSFQSLHRGDSSFNHIPRLAGMHQKTITMHAFPSQIRRWWECDLVVFWCVMNYCLLLALFCMTITQALILTQGQASRGQCVHSTQSSLSFCWLFS
jgi:hypothetical protein